MTEPIRKSVRVQCSVEHAFDVFTGRVDLWWPPSHRTLADARIAFEARVGGRFYVHDAAGTERELGQVLRWEPPGRVTYTWLPAQGVGPTQVDVTFRADGDHTLVAVTHSEGAAAFGEAWPQRARRFDAAWSEVLPAFVTYLQRREERP